MSTWLINVLSSLPIYSNLKNGNVFINLCVTYLTMLGGSLVTTAWRVLRLLLQETPSRHGG
jgi:hypothetical protein